MAEHADKLDSKSDPPIRDAATAMLVRDSADGVEVLAVRRATNQAFAAGAYVFPGGRVDDSDRTIPVDGRSAEVAEAIVGSPIGLGFWGAAARETFEESGVLIATDAGGAIPALDAEKLRRQVHSGDLDFGELLRELGATVDAGRIAYVARWVTPKGETRRFDTRFFLLESPEGAAAVHDEHETTEAVWVRPADLLERGKRGEAFLLPPTMANLNWLMAFETVGAALEAGFEYPVEIVAPKIVFGDDGSITLELGKGEELVLRRGSGD